MSFESLREQVCDIARQAGAAIMEVYGRSDFGVVSKDDSSPLTEADLAAHRIIADSLELLTPDLPVLSEEAADIEWGIRSKWQRYWLVDPLDGTKEFIKRNGEFTVNIALIDEGVPVLGVVFAPVLDWLYSGVMGAGAFKQSAAGNEKIQTKIVSEGRTELKVVASRTHRGEELDTWLKIVSTQFAEVETISMGSSLKICLVAEGKADIYPRLSLTSEWDTAAAQAVLESAGGKLVDAQWQPYRYNQKENLLNPHFFALGDAGYDYPKSPNLIQG